MNIAIGSGHAGFAYKQAIIARPRQAGHKVTDFGTDSEVSCGCPLFIRPVAQAVADGQFDRGLVLGGSGNGEAMVANRIRGVRCSLCWDKRSAELARRHNDANVLSLGQRMISVEAAMDIVDLWLAMPFDGGRHRRRIDMIDSP